MQDESLETLADILHVLASPSRLALLTQLVRPRAVGDLVVPPSREDAGLSAARPLSRQSTERHLEILADAGLVTWRDGGARNRGVKEYVLNHARLFAAVEELRVLTRLRATSATSEATLPLASDGAVPDPDSISGPRLILLRGVPEGFIYPLEREGRLLLGRGSECDVRLDHDAFVSTRHCALVREGAVVSVENGEGRNGTAVNERRLGPAETVRLRRGNLVTVGRSVLLYLDE